MAAFSLFLLNPVNDSKACWCSPQNQEIIIPLLVGSTSLHVYQLVFKGIIGNANRHYFQCYYIVLNPVKTHACLSDGFIYDQASTQCF